MLVKLFSTLSRYWYLILVAAILKWMTFHVWILHEQLGLDYRLSIWDSVVTNVVLLGFTLTIINIIVRYVPQTGKFWFALGLSLALTWVWTWLANHALIDLAQEDPQFMEFLSLASPIRWVIGFLVMAGASISSVFYYQTKQNETARSRDADTTAMVREAELQKLQLQLQPHFLFNSLNSINAMIITRPDQAIKMVQQLSDFLRITTRRADEHWVKFSEEWDYLQLYLSIEKVRFGHRLEVHNRISEEVRDWMIPTLILQPLVENAIKFGLYGTTEIVNIRFEAEIVSGILTVKLSNPFDPDSQPQRGSGFGLAGLQRRLYLLYARNDLLQTQVENDHFNVQLKLPQV